MKEIIVTKLTCKRCGHKWVARKSVVKLCPKCKNPWNTERKYKIYKQRKST